MTAPARRNLFSGCLMYALASLPLTALVVAGLVGFQRLGVWASLWPEDAQALCCLSPCLALALPLGLALYALPLRRGTLGHHLAQMTDRRGLGLLDTCLVVGGLTVALVMLFLLPPANPVLYLPVVLMCVAMIGRWALRNLTQVVPLDDSGQQADWAALSQTIGWSAADVCDYNFPPRALRLAASTAGPVGQVEVGGWRLEFRSASRQAGPDPAWQWLHLAGVATNLAAAPLALETLPKLTLRDGRGQEVSPRQAAVTPLHAEGGALAVLAPGASARLAVTFDVAAAEGGFDLVVRGRELAPGEEVVVPF